MSNTITRIDYGTEQGKVQQAPERDNAIISGDPVVTFAAANVCERRSLESSSEPGENQNSRSLSRMVRALLTTLQFYADGGSDSGIKARKALQLYKGIKYVS